MKPGTIEQTVVGDLTYVRTWSPNADENGESIGYTDSVEGADPGPPGVEQQLADLQAAVAAMAAVPEIQDALQSAGISITATGVEITPPITEGPLT